MNLRFALPVMMMSFSINALALVEKSKPVSMSSSLEILKLPTENRRMVLSEKPESHYLNFMTLAMSDDQPMNLRWQALMVAAQLRGERSTEDLLKAASHKQWYMRNAALVAMSEVNPPESVKLAQKLLKDKALVVRSAAVVALEKKATSEIRDILWDELNKDYNYKNKQSLWIRYQIVEVLAQKPLDREMKLFADLLSDKDARIHLPAIHGLEKLTGVRLGEGAVKGADLTGLWKDYVKKGKVAL